MPPLPTGVVTFLFSDIEASTRILEDHRAAAGPALARHHELLAPAIDASDGVPRLPMIEIHTPRLLDAAAEVLLAAGLGERAAFALGRARATDFPVPTIFPREPRLDAARDAIRQRLGVDQAERLMAEGAAAGVDESLSRITGWLRAG